jgi:phosphocarrier protein HPr
VSNGSIKKIVTIKNERGLHARAAAKFVQVAQSYKADVMVCRNNMEVSGHSIMGLLMLAAHPGMDIQLSATGADAKESVAALEGLIDDLFHEDK